MKFTKPTPEYIDGYKDIIKGYILIPAYCEIQVRAVPTSNCQLASLYYAHGLLKDITGKCRKDSDILESIDEAISVAAQNSILLDVHQEDCVILDRLFPKRIILKAPYVSTNTSKMCLYIIVHKNLAKK